MAHPDVPHWVDGAPLSGSGGFAPVHDPATGTVVARVSLATAADVDSVVASASRAASGWARTSLAQRTQVLFRMRELLVARRSHLAELVTREHGKVLADAEAEVARALDAVEFACGLSAHLEGAHTVGVSTGVDVHSLRQPVGVTAVVSPFNFPVMVPMWFIPLAVACGNSVVLKPSERCPSAPTELARLWSQAGLPDGVLDVVHGAAPAVDALLEHPDVDAVSFVGSTPVARHVYAAAARSGKRVQALGGAKNHMVVLADADLDVAAAAAVSAACGAAGERCMAVSVLVALDEVADDLVERVAHRMAALRVGDGRGGADMGPLISAEHRDRVAGVVTSAARDGARVILDGRGVTVPGAPGGYWFGPTLLDHVTEDMEAYRREIFGPVLCVVRVGSFAQALELVNRSPYGNGAAVFTRDGGAARRFEAEVQAGMVGVNVPIPVPVASYSFGGWKGSLFGDVHAHGPAGVQFFTRAKVVTSRWPDEAASEAPVLSFPRSA